MAKIIQSNGFLGNTMSNFSKKALVDLDVFLAKDALPQLGTKATSSTLNKLLEKKVGVDL